MFLLILFVDWLGFGDCEGTLGSTGGRRRRYSTSRRRPMRTEPSWSILFRFCLFLLGFIFFFFNFSISCLDAEKMWGYNRREISKMANKRYTSTRLEIPECCIYYYLSLKLEALNSKSFCMMNWWSVNRFRSIHFPIERSSLLWEVQYMT